MNSHHVINAAMGQRQIVSAAKAAVLNGDTKAIATLFAQDPQEFFVVNAKGENSINCAALIKDKIIYTTTIVLSENSYYTYNYTPGMEYSNPVQPNNEFGLPQFQLSTV